MWAKGGRGGEVIAVTNLDDSGPGSLRAAVETRCPRTVIFRVSGTIELKTPLRIREPFITIAGQTAPGDGICLKNYELQIGQTHDVIVRYLRCRPGDKTSQASEMDALTIWDTKDVIVDHCSATWSTDECLSVTNDSDRITVQHCLIAEALPTHGLGSIIGCYRGSISFLHNVYAHNRDRNPRASGYQAVAGHADDPGPRIEFRGNTLFNWSSGAGYTGSGKADAPERIAMNYTGNYLKPGADTSTAYRTSAFSVYSGAVAELFLDGNQAHQPPQPIEFQSELLIVRPGATIVMRETPLPFEPAAEKLTASAAHTRALAIAGASKPKRDAVDTRIIAGVKDGTGRQIKTVTEDAWPVLRGGEAEADTDGDGLPDVWEKAHALNPMDSADAAHTNPEGWTHLEVWLNAL
ncbi:pectate lyase [Brevifollis gellanilyticus]|uniref:Pectate lyase n=2 Tax=Brevifollis gellanilyticus TaxID=748831 RepID=A0A512M3M6_9BACT|nr:pectate lyase [Brevifollis gellanilyticus]